MVYDASIMIICHCQHPRPPIRFSVPTLDSGLHLELDPALFQADDRHCDLQVVLHSFVIRQWSFHRSQSLSTAFTPDVLCQTTRLAAPACVRPAHKRCSHLCQSDCLKQTPTVFRGWLTDATLFMEGRGGVDDVPKLRCIVVHRTGVTASDRHLLKHCPAFFHTPVFY